MEIFKVKFSWVEASPSGGPWMAKSEIKVYDAETAKELTTKIDAFLNNDRNGYRKYIRVDNIERL